MVLVHLECRAPDAGSKYLSGTYEQGSVTLRNRDDPGTRWEMNHLGNNQYTFLCMQDLDPTNFFDFLDSLNETRYLDGNTVTGTVQLVKNTDPPFTGTRWLRSNGPGDSLVFTCLGASDGPRMLDGWPGPGSVQLRPDTGFLGTRWITVTPL
ncbi:hypothetical protein [Streptomyces tanashiensis]|jgi:hypothetical protein|uniref:Uncharacterized protein n=1 Tax=Streptomyces tanashiensis TaxID=67367 RepID=A0ABY6QT81_9ACTN|nr:hypothetical protein [Streptomyces tanashiensis]UZX21011.1 hypothetical protein LDH80_09920 [Streptomyces tanashiensis]GGY53032.1 hypothetical protein GCM10010299_69000 [Streptomyces tanashiensis]